MLIRPKFRPHLQLATIPGEGTFVLSGGKETILRGRLFELIAPQVDGSAADDICERLAGQASTAEVYYTLTQLEKRGYLAEADDSLGADQAAWWSMQQIDAHAAARRLSENAVSVQGLGIDPEPLCELLDAAGIRIEKDGEYSVVLADHYLQPQLEECNSAALACGQPWLLVKPYGCQLWLGPLFRPGTTACWRCLAERLRANRGVESYLLDRQSLTEAMVLDRIRTPASAQVAWGLTVQAIESWIVRGELPDCDAKVRTFDQVSWEVKSHTLVKLPFCKACGHASKPPELEDRPNGERLNGHAAQLAADAQQEKPNGAAIDRRSSNGHDSNGRAPTSASLRYRPLILESRQKSLARDGGHRVVHPATTLERYGHHVSPITGAVSMLERTTPRDDGETGPGNGPKNGPGNGTGTMHVYIAGHNLARRHRDLGQLQGDLRNMSAGKGTTDLQARASGLCEGLERYSGVFRGDEERQTARLDDLDGAGIDVRDCLLFSERQYREREVINAKDSPYNFVPLPYDPQAAIEWSPVWSLSARQTRFLPTAFCYYDYPQPREQRFCIADSNGSAAGNTLEEAILQGFLELVERDSVALWWYNRVQRPGVDLGSFDDPYLRELNECLSRHQREMLVIDLTSDLGIPVFAAWSRRTGPNASKSSKADAGGEQIVMGFGAHLDAQIALLRAVTEMNQMLSYLIQTPLEAVSRDQVTDRETVEWLKTATAANQPYLLPAVDTPARTASDYARAHTDDVAEDVRAGQRKVEQLGLEMLVLNQTRPEIGLPVVKVIVPGLRHFWARFAPGRLYDVPARLGWVPHALTEAELNPIPMFL